MTHDQSGQSWPQPDEQLQDLAEVSRGHVAGPFDEQAVQEQEMHSHEGPKMADKKWHGQQREPSTDYDHLEDIEEAHDRTLGPVEHHDIAQLPSQERGAVNRNQVGGYQQQG